MDVPRLIDGGLAVDDRGIVRFVNGFNFDGVKRFYVLENHAVGFVRAWHGHRQEAKWVTVLRGAAVICAVSLDAIMDLTAQAEVHRCVMSQDKPQILYIPPGYANGSMALVEGTQIMHFSSTTIEESANDDLRFSANILRHVWEVTHR